MGLFPDHPARRPVIVTGASSGIGEATARALAAEGFPVVLGARRVELCAAISDDIEAEGGEAHAIALDLADPSSIDAFFGRALDAVGSIEVLVSNAAAIWPARVVDTIAGDFEELLRVNLVGPHRLVRHLLPGMAERRRGDLVFVTSDIVRFPRPAMAAYASSKWGLEGYVRTLQMELEGTGIRAVVVRPGPTRTEMGTDWDEQTTTWALGQWAKWGLARHGALLTPRAVAAAIVSAVCAQRGAHIATLDVQPEAIITEESS